jgi:hypothetical protein
VAAGAQGHPNQYGSPPRRGSAVVLSAPRASPRSRWRIDIRLGCSGVQRLDVKSGLHVHASWEPSFETMGQHRETSSPRPWVRAERLDGPSGGWSPPLPRLALSRGQRPAAYGTANARYAHQDGSGRWNRAWQGGGAPGTAPTFTSGRSLVCPFSAHSRSELVAGPRHPWRDQAGDVASTSPLSRSCRIVKTPATGSPLF